LSNIALLNLAQEERDQCQWLSVAVCASHHAMPPKYARTRPSSRNCATGRRTWIV